MGNANNLMKINADEMLLEVDQPIAEQRPARIEQEFPNISRLERFVLSTLDQEFNQTQQASNAVRQYVDYMNGKEKWEIRNSDPKTRPMWLRREPK